MLVDTHCHLNTMVKKTFNDLLTSEQLSSAKTIVQEAQNDGIERIINIGTDVLESNNSIELARTYSNVFAVVGIHPNDCSDSWRRDLALIKKFLGDKKSNKIVGIGECGMDFHYQGYNKQRQRDAFKAHIELALEYSLPVVIHMRDATDETLRIVETFVPDLYGVFHCFSEGIDIAKNVTQWGFSLGIGGTVTYPKNDYLRHVVITIDPKFLLLETDAPFLPPQNMRGKKNHPKYIKTIAEYIAKIRNESFETIAQQTTENAKTLFELP